MPCTTARQCRATLGANDLVPFTDGAALAADLLAQRVQSRELFAQGPGPVSGTHGCGIHLCGLSV
jgi:hypothetical protein